MPNHHNRFLMMSSFISGLLAGLLLGVCGCAGVSKTTAPVLGDNQTAAIAAAVKAEIQAALEANVTTGPITGVNYQSVLPVGMSVLLAIIVLTQTAANSFEDLLLHRQQLAKLKQNGAKP